MSQPMPKPGTEEVYPALVSFLAERRRKGIETYGTTLQTHNGRDALVDALEEVADLFAYLMQLKMERDAK